MARSRLDGSNSRPHLRSVTIYHTYLGLSGGSGVFILGATEMATLSSGGGHTTNTFALNYRVCNRLYQIINT